MTTREGETMNPAEAFFAVIEQADREARKAAMIERMKRMEEENAMEDTPCQQ